MDHIHDIVYKYNGCSLTEPVMKELKYTQKLRHFEKYKVLEPYLFKVHVACTCDDKCGGILCEADVTYTLEGLVDHEMDLEKFGKILRIN